MTKRTKKVQCSQGKKTDVNRNFWDTFEMNFYPNLKPIFLTFWDQFFCSIVDIESNNAFATSSKQQLHIITNPKLALHPRFGEHSCANFVNFGGLLSTQPILGGIAWQTRDSVGDSKKHFCKEEINLPTLHLCGLWMCEYVEVKQDPICELLCPFHH